MGSRHSGWGSHHRQRVDAIDDAADELVAACGVHAGAEARRRESEANSLSEARFWEQVRSTLGRRIAGRSGDPLAALATEVFNFLDSASENRERARELARAIESVGGAASQHPAVARAERCLETLKTRTAVLEIIEADVVAIADALADGAGAPAAAGERPGRQSSASPASSG